MTQRNPERRIEERVLCAELADIIWKPSGRTRRAVANLEDISRTGICIQCDRPIPSGSKVEINHPQLQVSGTVKYCVFREIGYFIGLEFEKPLNALPRVKHMLRPSTMLRVPASTAEHK